MFFVGLSGSFIPYVLLAGFMVISFLKFNLEKAKDVVRVNETTSEEVLFVKEVHSPDDAVFVVMDACQQFIANKCVSVFSSALRLSCSYLKPTVQKNRFLYDFLPKNDYFGLSPPSHC